MVMESNKMTRAKYYTKKEVDEIIEGVYKRILALALLTSLWFILVWWLK